MKRTAIIIFILSGISASGGGKPSESIRQFIDNGQSESAYIIDNESISSGDMLSLFYVNRAYAPAWFYQETISNNGYALLDYIRHIDQHGLQPLDYHLDLIEEYVWKTLLFKTVDAENMMKLDILLTDAFLLLGSHLYYGKVDPEKEGANWNMQRKDTALPLNLKLEEALADNNPVRFLNMLAPRYRSYWMMKEQLAFFLELNEQIWPPIQSSNLIKPGESNPVLPEIRERLIKLGYQLSDSISVFYDEEFEKHLKVFQGDRGLNTDGVIGKATLEGLNSVPREIINQLRVNMERFRWLPLQMPEKYIIVNIANFKLDLIDGTDTLISMRAIVGKKTRETPVFNAQISHIVFSPSWTIPPTIFENDVMPELLKGPGYLEKRNMKILRDDGSELAYSDIDWKEVSENNFPYIIRQEPGPGNAMGRVKFMFPNTYNIYIHDTPSGRSFGNDNRALSAGCVRVENPSGLALLLLSDTTDWSPEHIRIAMQQEKEQAVHLEKPVDVLLIYLTAWTDGEDRIQFRRDVYQRDRMVLTALNQ